MEVLGSNGPTILTPMSTVCEDFALTIEEEAAFKAWLNQRGVTPRAFLGLTDAESLEHLASLCSEWESSGDRLSVATGEPLCEPANYDA